MFVDRAVGQGERANRRVALAQPPKPTSKRKAAVAPAERVFDADDKDTYIVENILGERKRKGGKQYQVSWEGYTERTWEPARNLTDEDRAAFDHFRRTGEVLGAAPPAAAEE